MTLYVMYAPLILLLQVDTTFHLIGHFSLCIPQNVYILFIYLFIYLLIYLEVNKENLLQKKKGATTLKRLWFICLFCHELETN
jgi:hypothetical protein